MISPGRRRLTTALGLGLVLGPLLRPSPANARETALPVPASLQEAAALAVKKAEPLVLLVSLPGCPYCELVRRNYLRPAREELGVHAWQLNVNDTRTELLGFDGQVSTAASLTRLWKARFTPTVLFMDERGQELAERLVGIASPDFFGAYLDDRLATARKTLVLKK